MRVSRTPLFISAVILAVTLVACQSLDPSADKKVDELTAMKEEMYLPTVTIINTEEESLGSGVVIERQGNEYLVLTGNHVVGKQERVMVYFSKESLNPYCKNCVMNFLSFDGLVIRKSAEKDLALLRVTITTAEAPVAKMCTTDPRRFEQVYAVGAGLTEPIFPTLGIVSNVSYFFEDYPEVRYIHHSAPIAPGNSGGPLYKLENGSYCVTGINLRGRRGFSQFSYAVHLFELYSFLRNDSAKTN